MQHEGPPLSPAITYPASMRGGSRIAVIAPGSGVEAPPQSRGGLASVRSGAGHVGLVQHRLL